MQSATNLALGPLADIEDAIAQTDKAHPREPKTAALAPQVALEGCDGLIQSSRLCPIRIDGRTGLAAWCLLHSWHHRADAATLLVLVFGWRLPQPLHKMVALICHGDDG